MVASLSSSARTIRRRQGENFTLKLDRAEYWLSVGAQPSDTVKSIIKKVRKNSAAGAKA